MQISDDYVQWKARGVQAWLAKVLWKDLWEAGEASGWAEEGRPDAGVGRVGIRKENPTTQ